MLRKTLVILSLAFSAVIFMGCGNTAPIMNVDGAPVTTASGKKAKLAQVKKAILLAGASKGWQMREIKPGLIEATVHRSNLMAKVTISYTASSYNINYKDSTNMRYDGTNVHKRYNHWIRLLNDQIRNQLINL